MTASVLIIDLCNSARIPNIAIGYIASALRASGCGVRVFSPLSVGAKGHEREHVDTRWTDLRRRVFFSTHPIVVGAHELLHRAWRYRHRGRPLSGVVAGIKAKVDLERFDAVLISAYLDHHPTVLEIGRTLAGTGVPIVLGGPAFNNPNTVRLWWDVPGLAAIVGAEVDFSIGEIVRRLAAGEPLDGLPGVFLPDGRPTIPAPPLEGLAGLPLPDYSDFPWEKYEHRILPVMAGRGCEWGKCVFCSDVTSVNGRGFRSRGIDSVVAELRALGPKHDAKSVYFVDIKLNSDVAVWRGISKHYQSILPGGEWVGVVHVDNRPDNGLSAADLETARAAGMVRISCGLETGSQRLNNRMAKGTEIERVGRFLTDAHTAGISTRATMMLGFPGEMAADLEQTLGFLELHETSIDRVHMSRFAAMPGTEFATQYRRRPDLYPGLSPIDWDYKFARGRYRYLPAGDKGYRRAKARVLDMVHAINARPLPAAAEIFNGVM